MRTRATLLLIVICGVGCNAERLTFHCSNAAQCGPSGVCAVGVCAFPDQACGSGYRYDQSAADLRGVCVVFDDGGIDMGVPADLAETDLKADMGGEADLAAVDLATPLDMTQPVCTPAARRCNPMNHAIEQVCNAFGFWTDNACSTATTPVWACSESKGKCADTAWVQWGYSGPSPIPSPRFTTIMDPAGNGQDIIRDNYTNLQWQLRHADATYTWADAKSYCSALSYGGLHDWRVPSIVELSSILDRSLSSCSPGAPGVYAPFFSYTKPAESYWTSVPVFSFPTTEVWAISTRGGHLAFNIPTSLYRVRCVR